MFLADIEEKIMQHIQSRFKKALRYAAIASIDEPSSTVYIQIILHTIMNKKMEFLRAVAGWYRRTCSSRNRTDPF